MPEASGTSVKVPSPLLWKRIFLPPFRPGGPQATITPLYRQGPDSGTGAVARVHIDVVGDEKIELAVAIVIDEGTAGIPALAFGGNAGFGGDIGERAVAIVVVEDVFAEVGNEEIVEAVVLVLAPAPPLSPPRITKPNLLAPIA